jgi:HAD superfamily hydrolase (TIGR01509 family)
VTDARPAAVLFDMDGTLVDTEPYWMDAEVRLIAEWGGVWTHEDALSLVGSGLMDSAMILRSRGVDLAPEAIIDLLTDRVLTRIDEHVPWRPGSLELLNAVRAVGIPTGLVTMSISRMAHRIVEAMPGHPFDVVVPGDGIPAKPLPDPYLIAAERLGVDARDTVALEDSEPGVASAVAAGCATIAMPLHIALPESPAYTLWADGAEGKGLDDLLAVFGARSRA